MQPEVLKDAWASSFLADVHALCMGAPDHRNQRAAFDVRASRPSSWCVEFLDGTRTRRLAGLWLRLRSRQRYKLKLPQKNAEPGREPRPAAVLMSRSQMQ